MLRYEVIVISKKRWGNCHIEKKICMRVLWFWDHVLVWGTFGLVSLTFEGRKWDGLFLFSWLVGSWKGNNIVILKGMSFHIILLPIKKLYCLFEYAISHYKNYGILILYLSPNHIWSFCFKIYGCCFLHLLLLLVSQLHHGMQILHYGSGYPKYNGVQEAIIGGARNFSQICLGLRSF